MRKDFGPQTWIYPMPVFIIGTYDENGKADAMNAAWGGTYDYNMVTVSLSSHKTTENFEKTKAFTLSFGTKKTVTICDYVGLVSAKKEPNKIEKAGLHPYKSEHVNAPMFEEFPLTLECEVVSFVDGTLVGKIINASVDESILTNGKIDPKKLEAISFDTVNNKYLLVENEVADAFKEGLKLK